MSNKKFLNPDCVLYICCGSKCKKRGGKHIFKELKVRLKAAHLKGSIQVIKTGCTDRCKWGPVVAVMPDNKWYLEVSSEEAVALLATKIDKIR